MIRSLFSKFCAPLPVALKELTAAAAGAKLCCHYHHLPPAAVVVRWSSSGTGSGGGGGNNTNHPNACASAGTSGCQQYPTGEHQHQQYQHQPQQQPFQHQQPPFQQQQQAYAQHAQHVNQNQQCAANAACTGGPQVGPGAPAASVIPPATPLCPGSYQMQPQGQSQKEAQAMHDNAVRTQTQPSRMPEFYNPSTDFSRLGQPSATQQQQQRQFAASKTYRSLTVPLKSSRLANPFPEPVKQMPSCQVSDQEKAQRMYNDSRLPGVRH